MNRTHRQANLARAAMLMNRAVSNTLGVGRFLKREWNREGE